MSSPGRISVVHQTTSPEPIRVLLVEDHIIVREALRLLLENQAGAIIIGEAGNQQEALQIARAGQPDIILLDLQLGKEHGLSFLPDLLAATPRSKVIVLTASGGPQEYAWALASGACGIVLKDQASCVLLQAIERVQAGEVWVKAGLMVTVMAAAMKMHSHAPASFPLATAAARVQSAPDVVASAGDAARISLLTEREREIITLIANGLQNKQIAQRLYVSESTVRHSLPDIYEKLHVQSRAQLLAFAHRHGLTSP